MFRGFNLKMIGYNSEEPGFQDLYRVGIESYKENASNVKRELDEFLSPDGVINASAMQAAWFNEAQYDIFLSHSHSNKDLAVALAGYFWKYFRLTTFVDSCIWGHSDILLRRIDEEYRQDGKRNFDYGLRNISTSHVHMMLASALSKAIDNCECLIFLNTPESVSTDDVMEQTASPWIYYELSVSTTIRQSKPRHLKTCAKALGGDGILKNASISGWRYDLPYGHLADIDIDDVRRWRDLYDDINRLLRRRMVFKVLYDMVDGK